MTGQQQQKHFMQRQHSLFNGMGAYAGIFADACKGFHVCTLIETLNVSALSLSALFNVRSE